MSKSEKVDGGFGCSGGTRSVAEQEEALLYHMHSCENQRYKNVTLTCHSSSTCGSDRFYGVCCSGMVDVMM